TMSGNDVESAIKPLAIINGNIAFLSNPKLRTIAKTIGVSIKAAPSFAKKAATTEPNSMIKINIFNPLPFDALTICIADHSKKPISSNMSEIRITATKDKVAFQTIQVTSSTTEKITTPVNIETTAPINAVILINRHLGCNITKININTNNVIANIVIRNTHNYIQIHKYMGHYWNSIESVVM